jgi:hypothetical protein
LQLERSRLARDGLLLISEAQGPTEIVMRRAFASILLAAALPAAPLVAKHEASRSPETSIPFVAHHGILDWKVADRTTLYIQSRDRKWYRATVFGDCRNLSFATQIGFDTGAYDAFDRTSTIIAEGQRCSVESVVASGPPPKTAK